MKRIFSIIAALLLVATAASAQLRYAAVAGINVNSMRFKQTLVPTSHTVGAEAGVMGELIFPGIGFGIDLGLYYNMQGGGVKLGDRLIWSSLGYGNEHVMLHTLQIPLHMRFKWTRMEGLEDVIAPFVYGGPDFTIQLAHNGAKAFDCSGGDMGLTAGVGFELMRRWQVMGSYTWGMTYICKTRLLDDFSARSRQWTFRVAYFF